MTLTQFWLTMLGMSAFALVLGVGCYAVCRWLRPHPVIAFLLTGFVTYCSIGTNVGFLLIFPVSYLNLRCGVELHRKTRRDDNERSQSILFTATGLTLLLGLLVGYPYLDGLGFYAPREWGARKIGAVLVTLLAVVPSLAPALWMRHLNETPSEFEGDEK